MNVVLGVDPGSTTTGFVVRDGEEVVSWLLAERPDGEGDLAYLQRVGTTFVIVAAKLTDPLVGIETVQKPNVWHGGKRQVLDPQPMIITGMAAGVVVGLALQRCWHVVMVPPAKNGSSPLPAYPSVLVGERERSGTGKLRHARSAWDVAGTAARLHRAGAA